MLRHNKDVDGRNKSGHDELLQSQLFALYHFASEPAGSFQPAGFSSYWMT
jgi:hypothetical protein